jgi:hypothetical protein
MIFYVKPCNTYPHWLQYALNGSVAQGLEQGTHNPLVVGSNPTGPTKKPHQILHQANYHQKPLSSGFFIPTQPQHHI